MKIINPYVPYGYANLEKELFALQRCFPKGKIASIGCSVEGRNLYFMQIGKGQPILLVGAHHGREYITSAYLMMLLQDLLEKQEGEYAEMLSRFSFFILPMLNPDGVQLSILGEKAASKKQKKMLLLEESFAAWKANANGIDLNRQYPCFFWEKEHEISCPASERYRGAFPASEPETQALMQFCHAHSFLFAITFHAKGEEIYYADENTPALQRISFVLAKELAKQSGYCILPPSKNPKIYGAGFENWFRETYQKPCLLIELSPNGNGALPHAMDQFDAFVWEKTKNFAKIFLQFGQFLTKV